MRGGGGGRVPAFTLTPLSAFTSAWDDAPPGSSRLAHRFPTQRLTEAAVRRDAAAQVRPDPQRSALGARMTQDATDALAAVCARYGVVITNFEVTRRSIEGVEGVERGCHEWRVELKSPGAARLDAAIAAVALDRELQRLNDDYEAERKGGGLDLPVVRMLPEGTFERGRDKAREVGARNKVSRCRSGRALADEPAQRARSAVRTAPPLAAMSA